jgi:nicotinate phosphoribosyltransferase
MEVFSSGPGLLCGMKEVLTLLAHVLPPQAAVWAIPEGNKIDRKEVVLRIRAPYSFFAIYETAYLGILAHETGWATAAQACVEAAGDIPIISFGARHVHPEVSARMEYAAWMGGCSGCSTPAGARLAGLEASGTIPHALILCFGDTVPAVLAFDQLIPSQVLRIALVDTFKDEAEESLRVAEVMGQRLWGVRLDTPSERGRVTAELVKEVRARLDQAGHQHVRIVVSGGIDVARIRYFKERAAPVDAFGVGSAISGAPPIDFTADIKEIDGYAVAKRGRIPGITGNPRLEAIDLSQWKHQP